MKTQISNNSFQADKNYSGVYLQQGRMITDADWNELTDIEKTRLHSALADLVAGGAPRGSYGLRIIADPEGSTNVYIQPGRLYAEGVPAELRADAKLSIDKQPDYPLQADFSGQSLHLYADIWERSMTALEDESLMDPGLHGADTATRTQTMLQVKWSPSSGSNALDPRDAKLNPAQGSGELKLRLALITGSADSCDPCASQANVDERIGNYLFRVEVHHYDASTNILTLKWSRDNGSEACRLDGMPPGFNQGPWVWEFYSDETEQLLGNHFAPNAKNMRGLLRETFTVPTGASEPKTYVRQWDGYLTIDLKTLSNPTHILNGMDRGVPLAQGAAASASHGRVSVSDGILSINLERMELHLQTKERQFVPGDYWLATVRESVQVSGQYVLPAMDGLTEPATGATPCGIRHHYLYLGEIGINKRLIDQGDAFMRRMSFPPLTNIQAEDIGFSNTCSGLYGSAENLQQALDTLCSIDASDIAYPMPVCTGGEVTVRQRLTAALDPDDDGKLNVGHALDTLLCRLKADSLPVNKLDSDLCTDLKIDEVVTVQDALKVLCSKSSDGCAVVVRSSSHFVLLLEEFSKQDDAQDLWLCLPAGTYELPVSLTISGKRSLRISGQAQEAVHVSFGGSHLTLVADEVVLENLTLNFTSGNGQLVLSTGLSTTRGCSFGRTSTTENGPAMVTLGGQGSSTCRLHWEHNTFAATARKSTDSGATWLDTLGAGNIAIKKGLGLLSNAALLENTVAYDKAVHAVAKEIIKLPQAERTVWKNNLVTVSAPQRLALAGVKRVGAASLIATLGNEKPSTLEVVTAVKELVAVWIQYQPAYALRLESAKVGGLLNKNEFSGWLLLANGVSGYHPPRVAVVGSTVDGDVVESSGEDLYIEDNSLAGIKANLPSGSLNGQNRLTQQVSGYGRIFFKGNTLEQGLNSLVAAHFLGEGNTWNRENEAEPLGSVIGHRGVFNGNLVEFDADALWVTSTIRKDRVISSGNLGVNLASGNN
nr:DUF6519 domain-containing protein [uncultured Desulfobulbus sp.]